MQMKPVGSRPMALVRAQHPAAVGPRERVQPGREGGLPSVPPEASEHGDAGLLDDVVDGCLVAAHPPAQPFDRSVVPRQKLISGVHVTRSGTLGKGVVRGRFHT